jgi:heptosyltransferase-1
MRDPEAPRVLLVRRSSLGDVIVGLPVLVALRRRYPRAYLAWLVEDRFADAVRGHEDLDELITMSRMSGRTPLAWMRETLEVGRRLREACFDWAVDLQGRFKSAVMVWLSRAPRRIGYHQEMSLSFPGWFTETVSIPRPVAAVPRSLTMAEHLGAPMESASFKYPVLPEAEAWASEFLAAEGAAGAPLVGLVLGTSQANKCWPVPYFVELIGRLREEGSTALLLGGPGERNRAEEIQAALPAPALDAVGRTDLTQLAALLARCNQVVAGDTGALHMAVALDKPVVGLYGPTSPALTGPHGDQHRVLWSNRDCSPCNRRPTCADFGCMADLRPDEVLAAVRQLNCQPTAPVEGSAR